MFDLPSFPFAFTGGKRFMKAQTFPHRQRPKAEETCRQRG